MQLFSFYLAEGWYHILDLLGYDHILFVAALCAPYGWQHWRRLLVLVSAFTVGHSLTLALATLQWVVVPSYWVELLIPVSIVLTAVGNLLQRNRLNEASPTALWQRYGMALFFGLIHGLGFSNFLRAMLSGEASLFWPLLAFNVGLELGQLLVVALLLGLAVGAYRLGQRVERGWRLGLSLVALGVAAVLVWERI